MRREMDCSFQMAWKVGNISALLIRSFVAGRQVCRLSSASMHTLLLPLGLNRRLRMSNELAFISYLSSGCRRPCQACTISMLSSSRQRFGCWFFFFVCTRLIDGGVGGRRAWWLLPNTDYTDSKGLEVMFNICVKH